MITSTAGIPAFNKAEIEDMVDSLEDKFILLDAEAFTLLVQILVATESCQAQSEGLFKCLVSETRCVVTSECLLTQLQGCS